MADVARYVGVSTATVSRALKEPSKVSEATRELVEAAIRHIGYVPNSLARNLRTQRSGTVILVVRDIGNPFYLDIFRGVEAAARARGLSVLMGNTENEAERERRYFDMVRERAADGMILMTGKLPAAFEGERAQPLPPVVVALEYLIGRDVPTVRIDNAGAAREAVDYLIELGHRRIAHVSGPIPEVMSVDRCAGYRAAMERAGLREYIQVAAGDYSIGAGRRRGVELLRGRPRPTAVSCANDEIAIGVIEAAREMGISVPRELSVIGFDDIVFARHFSPPLSTVRQPRREIGVRAMELLAQCLEGDEVPSTPIVMPTQLIRRGTTAPRPD